MRWHTLCHECGCKVAEVGFCPNISNVKTALRRVANIFKLQREIQRFVSSVEHQHGPVPIRERAGQLLAVRPALLLAA
jgi:hypothetical protein